MNAATVEEGARQDATLAYDRFVPGEEGLREALTSTGNGYFCTRGAAEWQDARDVHYPGTYAHGGYNRETTQSGTSTQSTPRPACTSARSSSSSSAERGCAPSAVISRTSTAWSVRRAQVPGV